VKRSGDHDDSPGTKTEEATTNHTNNTKAEEESRKRKRKAAMLAALHIDLFLSSFVLFV
jgi:hypothetical protein